MIQLVYTSYTPQPLTEEQLEHILQSSRKNNRDAGITGILLYKQSLFLQVLEGDEASVLETYNTICEDSRHQDVELVLKIEIESRDFPDWEMAFQQIPVNTPDAKDLHKQQMKNIETMIKSIASAPTREYLSGFVGLLSG